MYRIIAEGKARIKASTGKVTAGMDVFYNPVMKLNRDVSIALLNAVDDKNMSISLPMAASGIRGIRFLLELEKGKLKEVVMNDSSGKAARLIRQNIRLNKVKAEVLQKDARLFLLESNGFDYIDIDPFGSPNKFLDSAVIRLSRKGILAVTATDTAALTGTYANVCRRKYWAEPKLDYMMHERALRILIRKVQLIGVQYDKALTPIFSYYRDHYYRIFFRCAKSKEKCDEVIRQHETVDGSGPMWAGKLHDKKLAKEMHRKSRIELVKTIYQELDCPGFLDVHAIAEKKKLHSIRKMEDIIRDIRKKGYKATRTHFSKTGIKTDIDERKFAGVIAAKAGR